MMSSLRRAARVAVVSVVLMAPMASAESSERRSTSKREEVSALLHRKFASVEDLYAWTAGYTQCCGCQSPVVLRRGEKEAVVVICTRTSGRLTSETFVFDKHADGYHFMLLRNVLNEGLAVRDEGEDIVLFGKTPVLRVPWSGVGAE